MHIKISVLSTGWIKNAYKDYGLAFQGLVVKTLNYHVFFNEVWVLKKNVKITKVNLIKDERRCLDSRGNVC